MIISLNTYTFDQSQLTKSWVKVALPCWTLCNLVDFSLSGSSVHGILQAGILELGSCSLLQGIFATKGLNPDFPHCRRIFYHLSHQGSPKILEWVAYLFSKELLGPGIELGVSCIAGGFFTSWATREALKGPILKVLVKQTHYCYFIFNFFFKKFMQLFRKKVANFLILFVAVQLLSLVRLCDLMDYSMPGFPVLHYLLEFTQTYLHWVCDAIQPFHPLHPPLFLPSICPNSRIFTISWLFTSGGQSIGVSASALVLSMNIQSWFPLGLTGLISLLSKGLSRVFSSTVIWKRRFFSTQPSLWSNSHIHERLLKKTIALTIQTFVNKVMSLFFFFKKLLFILIRG